MAVAPTHPTYYSQVVAGNMFVGVSAAPQTGILIPTYNTTSPTFGLWNPQGSGKNAVLVRFAAGWVSTTGAPGAIMYAKLTGAGSAIATGGPLSAVATGTPTNALVGSGSSSAMKFVDGSNTTTLTAAGTIFDQMAVSQLTTTGATTSAPMWTAVEEFNGRLIIPPGVFFYIVGTTALLSKFNLSLAWYETAAA